MKMTAVQKQLARTQSRSKHLASRVRRELLRLSHRACRRRAAGRLHQLAANVQDGSFDDSGHWVCVVTRDADLDLLEKLCAQVEFDYAE